MTFEDFYKSITADERWMETMSMIHKYKPIKEVAMLVYGTAVSEGTLNEDISEHRKHIHNKLAKTPVKIERGVQLQQGEKKPEQLEVKVYATDEQREYWLKQFEAQIKEITIKPVIRLSHKQIAEEGDWLPKKKAVGFDPGYLPEHEKKLHECRVKTIKDRHPDFTDEQIEKYIEENF